MTVATHDPNSVVTKVVTSDKKGTKQGRPSSGLQRSMQRIIFWLDVNKPEQAELFNQIEDLKDVRSFHPTLRKGLRLMGDLMAGRTDVLYEMFPWIREQHAANAENQRKLEAHIQRLETILTQHSAGVRGAALPLDTIIEDDDDGFQTRLVTVPAEEIGANFLSTVNFGTASKNTKGSPQSLDLGELAPPSYDEDEDDLLLMRKT